MSDSDQFNYEDRHAELVDAIRYGASGAQSPGAAAKEALHRWRSGPTPLRLPDDVGLEQLQAVIAEPVRRAAAGELSTDDAAHIAIEGLRGLGAPIGPRPPDDPRPSR